MQTACWIICVNFIDTAVCVSRDPIFSLREGECCFLAICPVIRLSSFYLVTDVICVRLEWNFLCPRFQTSPHGWPVWQLLLRLYVVWYSLVVAYVLPQVHFRSDENCFPKFSSILIIWNCIVQYSLAVTQGRRDHSTGFVQAKSSIVKLRAFFREVKDMKSLDNMKRKLYLQSFIMISLLGILYCVWTQVGMNTTFH